MPTRTAEYQKSYRARRKANSGRRLTEPVESETDSEPCLINPPPPSDPALAVADWAAARLVVPAGHPNAGQPFVLPSYFTAFLKDGLQPGVREAGCFVARKNAKSACVAVLILAHLVDDGPLRSLGWRGGVASLSREKAVELWQQASDIATASDLEDIRFGKVPRLIQSPWGRCDFLSADRTAGHASGFDLAVVDEIGLFPERGRALVSGLMSSTSARDGRVLAISVIGDSPLSREMIDRKDDPATVVVVYGAPKGCALDDEAAWLAANPALGSIKSHSYMVDMARRASANPAEQSSFRAFDLNQPGSPVSEMIVPLDRWVLCASQPRPEREGPCFVGIDIGGSVSLTAAALYWPQSGRIESYGGCGDEPDLAARGEADGVGSRYARMHNRGELRVYPGRVTPCGPFLEWITELLGGATPALALADRYRQAETLDALAAAGAVWPMTWRAQGSGKDGSADVRAFQKAVVSRSLRPGENLLLESAIAESLLRYDGNGNPSLDKSRKKGRIDALSAAILAVGAGDHAMAQSQPLVMAVA